jgi:hypothetical protein
MVPLTTLFCPLAAIGISGLYAAWHRKRLALIRPADHVLRQRVAYMLWMVATRA